MASKHDTGGFQPPEKTQRENLEPNYPDAEKLIDFINKYIAEMNELDIQFRDNPIWKQTKDEVTSELSKISVENLRNYSLEERLKLRDEIDQTTYKLIAGQNKLRNEEKEKIHAFDLETTRTFNNLSYGLDLISSILTHKTYK